MNPNSGIAAGGLVRLDRRAFLGGVAVTTAVAASGGLASAAAAVTRAAPVAAVFMDMPFVDTTGLHRPYRPPTASYTTAQLNPEHHFFV